MKNTFHAFWVGILWIPALFLALAGCRTVTVPDSQAQVQSPPAPAIQLSPHQKVGTITEVFPEPALVVIRQSVLSPSLVAELYVSRDPQFRPTAVLQHSPYQFGDHIGFFILAGEPAAGDEVILPGNDDYRELLAPYE